MALAKVFSVLPRRNASEDDDEAMLEGFRLALHGVEFAALVETITALVRGQVHGLSLKYCPTPPELSKAVRDRMAINHLEVNRPKVDYVPVPFQSLEMKRDAEKLRMADAGRMQLRKVSSFANAQDIAKHANFPPGTIYSAFLGAFYGPPGYTAAPEINSPDDPVDDARQSETRAGDDPEAYMEEPEDE